MFSCTFYSFLRLSIFLAVMPQLIGKRAKRAIHYQGLTNGNWRYMYIYIYIYMVRARHFSSVGPVVRNVGGVKCQLFLKCSNYW